MLTYVESRNVLFTSLAVSPEHRVSFEDLQAIQKQVAKKTPDAYLDLTRDAIINTLQLNEEIFEYTRKNKVGFSPTVSFREGMGTVFTEDFVSGTINFPLPDDIRKALLEACQHVLNPENTHHVLQK